MAGLMPGLLVRAFWLGYAGWLADWRCCWRSILGWFPLTEVALPLVPRSAVTAARRWKDAALNGSTGKWRMVRIQSRNKNRTLAPGGPAHGSFLTPV